MIIKLPHVDVIDTLHLPDDFEERVKHSFKVFTECTNKAYTYEDKLMYLDNLRNRYLRSRDAEEEVKRLILDTAEFQLDEHGDFPDKDEFWDMSFMRQCFEKGDSKFRDEYEKTSRRDNEKTLTAIFRIIQIITNWEDDD